MTEMPEVSKNNYLNLKAVLGAREMIKIKMNFKCMCLQRAKNENLGTEQCPAV
jgi:hypothetical protein